MLICKSVFLCFVAVEAMSCAEPYYLTTKGKYG